VSAAGRTKTLRQLREELDAAGARRAFQREVHALAGRMSLGVEQDRALREIDEWDAEIDALMDEALEAGYSPEDFE
jgi:hypothetical protein